MQRILVGLDESERAPQVLAAAMELARSLGGQLHLLRICPVPIYPYPAGVYSVPPDTLPAVLEESTRRSLDLIAQQRRESFNVYTTWALDPRSKDKLDRSFARVWAKTGPLLAASLPASVQVGQVYLPTPAGLEAPMPLLHALGKGVEGIRSARLEGIRSARLEGIRSARLEGVGEQKPRVFQQRGLIVFEGQKGIAFLLDDLRGRAAGNERAPVASGTGAEINHVIGPANRLFIVLDNQHGVSKIAQPFERFDQPVIIALMQTDGRFIQNV